MNSSSVSSSNSFLFFSKSFFELTKARLAISVVFSSVVGYLLAVDSFDLYTLVLLSVGGYCMVGASNSFNQIIEKDIDFVIGSRVKKFREKSAMQPQQIFGNWLATFLMRVFFKSKFTDLGPFRAIKFDTLMSLKMQDPTYGWTVEMQLKILKQQFTYKEIPVKYRNRIGVSKVSGTVKGSIFAGIKILTWIIKYSFK